MGGARPKAVVENDIGLWVAKFGRPDDRWNNPRVEHAMLEMARSCGIDGPEVGSKMSAAKMYSWFKDLIVKERAKDMSGRG